MNGILYISFGTTYDEARVRDIDSVQKAIEIQYPGVVVEQAFTSNIVRSRLNTRGVFYLSVEEAFIKMKQKGVANLTLSLGLLLPGEEFKKKILRVADRYRDEFKSIRIARPLMATNADILFVSHTLSQIFKPQRDHAYVLMGHGTRDASNQVYVMLEQEIQKQGRSDIFIGTVEAQPSLKDIMPRLLEGNYSSVTLAPLMQVAGDHATNDMAGSDESWEVSLKESGFQVESVLRGLGSYKEFIERYISLIESAKEI